MDVDIEKLDELDELEKAATSGVWWTNGLDIESSHVIVAEGERWVQLYNTETEQPSRRIKPHQRKPEDDTGDDDIIVLSTGSILGDRDVEEAQATADYIVALRNIAPALIALAREALTARGRPLLCQEITLVAEGGIEPSTSGL